MTKKGIGILITALFVISQASFAQQSKLLSFSAPPEKLSILGEGFISTGINERDFTLSPDGSEMFYTISTPKSTFQTIVFSKRSAKGEWSAPEIASFAGEYSDLEPAFSADGNTIYFSSNRPTTGTGTKDFDMWKVTRVGNGWSNPENLGAVVNTEADEFYPSIAKNGNLYFTAAYKGGPGREDIYMSSLKDNQYQKPVSLDTMVNSKFYEFNAFVDPEEKFILFTSYGRKDDAGGGDIYMSLKEGGKWKPARNLKDLNSKQLDYCPSVSPDGKVLFLTSERHQLPVSFAGNKSNVQKLREINQSPLNGTGNIYWVDFQKVYNQSK
jgi:Tol biopolymer transport system component